MIRSLISVHKWEGGVFLGSRQVRVLVDIAKGKIEDSKRRHCTERAIALFNFGFDNLTGRG